jgi:antitoxin Phd
MDGWPVQDAKARFSEFLEAAVHDGPQLVTKRGLPAAVLVRIDEWERLQAAQPSLKGLLMAAEPTFEYGAPTRGAVKRRAGPDFKR